jgi:hypothetical protein
MSEIANKIEDEEVDDILTNEEHQIIETIQKVSFVKPFNPVKEEVKVEVEVKPWSIWSIFNNPVNIVEVAGALGGTGTRYIAPFDLTRRVGLNKVVTINNISGKNAYVILSPAPIKTIDSGGLGVKDISLNVTFSDKGDYKPQQLSILNNTRSEYDLDNSQFYYTLFLHIDDKWKQVWENRRINGRKYDINILQRHVLAALDNESLPKI